MSDDSALEYMAFLSYRHADNEEEDMQWATWLQDQLEHYEIPEDLIGTINERGEVIPKRIYPIFRDEVSLPTNANLTNAIVDALDKSQFLIVLCSPRAVMSRYVNEEILHFKKSGKSNQIMAGIILGVPNASVDDSKIEDPEDARTLECFPKALQHHLDTNNELDLSSYSEPIAANFRLPDGSKGLTNIGVYRQKLLESGLGKKTVEARVTAYEQQLNNAKLKLVAGILGVPLERLSQRDRLHQLNKARESARRSKKISAAMSLLAIVSIASGLIAFKQWQQANQSFAEARNIIDEFVTDISVNELADYPGLQPLRDRFSQRAVDKYSAFIERGIDGQSIQLGYATALSARAEVLSSIGSAVEAETLFRKAMEVTLKAIGEAPNNVQAQMALAKREFELGHFYWQMQRKKEAIPVALSAANRLDRWKTRPEKVPEAVYLLSRIYNLLGNCRRESSSGGREDYETSLSLARSVLKFHSEREDVLSRMSAAAHNISLIEKADGNYEESLRLLDLSAEYMTEAQKANPGSPKLASDKATEIYNRALLLKGANRLEEAARAFELAINARRSVVKSNPMVTRYSWQLAEDLKENAILLTLMGKYDAALSNYLEAEKLLEEIIRTSDDRPHYGVTLMEIHQSIAHYYGGDRGDTKRDEHQWGKALEHAVTTGKRLRSKYPANQAIQYNLSIAYGAQAYFEADIKKDHERALKGYRLALDAYSNFIDSHQNNENSRQLTQYLYYAQEAISNAKKLNRLDEVVEIADLVSIVEANRLDMEGARNLSTMLNMAGKLFRDNKQEKQALGYYQQALDVGLPAWEKDSWNWWLRQVVGDAYLNLYQIHVNMDNRIEAFIAGQNWLRVWGQPMHGTKNADILLTVNAELASENDHSTLKSALEKKYAMKGFALPTDFGGVRYPFQVYITNIAWPNDPLADQARWVEEVRGGKIPEDVREAFRNLHKIAHENNVSFVELVEYALSKSKKESP